MNFRGFKPSVDDLKRVKQVVDSNFSSFASDLTSEIKTKTPKLIKNLESADFPKKSGFVKNALLVSGTYLKYLSTLLMILLQSFPN